MKIFSFPHVVVYELMKEFNPPELVMLSLCSKTAHACVKTFTNADQNLKIELSSDDHGSEYLVSCSGRVLVNVTTRNMGSVDRSELRNKAGQLYNHCRNVVRGCQETTDYICDLLKVPVATIKISQEADLWLLDFTQRRQEQRLENLNTRDLSISGEDCSKIISCGATERLECAIMTPRNYRFEGKLPTAKHLYIRRGGWISREQLLGLESRIAQLTFTDLTSADINALMKSWLNGGFPNLKYLKIDGRYIDDQIYEGIGDRLERVQEETRYKWDASKRDAKFFSTAFHIRREDNVVATVILNVWSFMMVVWPDLNGNRV